MTHADDDLELYALGALPAEARDRVARHVAACGSCRTAAADVAETVALLPDAMPLRDPPPGLKARILAAARAEPAPRRLAPRLPWSLPRVASAALAVAVVALLAIDVSQAVSLRSLRAERSEYESVVATVAHGERSWYMAGIGAWRGSGGNLVQPANGDAAFAVFHGLRDLPEDQMYAVWLIAPDGKWTRAANFRSDGLDIQMVQLAVDARGADWCAVTLETTPEGTHQGPLIMQSSRIAPPTR